MKSRRQLLKAAASVPVIYTLGNGATAAAASSSCLGDPNSYRTEQVDNLNSGTGAGDAGPMASEPLEPGTMVTLSDGKTYALAAYDETTGEAVYIASSCWASIGMSASAASLSRIA
jgi:hypothetical protein